jgi:hypothetical protein
VQVLVHLCFVLPQPACFIYQGMKPGTMQKVLAQRGGLEKGLRQHLSELVFVQQQLRAWVKQVRARGACLGVWRAGAAPRHAAQPAPGAAERRHQPRSSQRRWR